MIVAALASAALVVAALRMLGAADADIEVTRARVGPTPVTLFQSSVDAPPGGAPVVVIAHGFAGSQQLMTPFAVSLARNGYLAVTFDFYGHGRNLRPLGGDVTRVEGATRNLVEQTGHVVDYALSQPAAGGGLAVLGHSMASDVVVRYALADPRVEATIAVSMFSPAVTATGPRNLLIISGGYEGFLRREALRAVAMTADDPQEGVTSGRFADGSARRAAVIPGVEHVGVLYSAGSMREAVAWLNRVFERDRQIAEVDRRGGAIVLLLLGIVLLAWPLSRLLPRVASPPRGANWFRPVWSRRSRRRFCCGGSRRTSSRFWSAAIWRFTSAFTAC
jgi:dienelactone hydrolase